MCSIVACHLCQLYGLPAAWVLNIGVQVFLMISGWLYGLRPDFSDIRNWYAKRLIRICIPYWIILTLTLILNALFASRYISIREAILCISCIKSGLVPNAAHLWYVSVMLLCYLLTPALSYLWRRKPWSIAPCCIALLCFGNQLVSEGIWCVDYIIGFILGRLVREGVDERYVLSFTVFVAGSGSLVLWIISLQTGVSVGTSLHLLGGPLLFSLFRLLLGSERYKPSNSLRSILRLNDSYSYEIYLVHQLLIIGDFSLALIFPSKPFLVIVLTIIWSLLAGITLHKIASPIQRFAAVLIGQREN